ncbi:spermatogenesis-associated protein 20 [Schistocerca gregaria]|uniref:spermatogenesis-associated protein 20 n=1 Tax=Schistocerca gregaria TaxID=7010 RepID=UPI00211DD14E|nr:spermatogenesis-associated protein 20 [Schistocerca gregaria]
MNSGRLLQCVVGAAFGRRLQYSDKTCGIDLYFKRQQPSFSLLAARTMATAKGSEEKGHQNRLSFEKSPYLLQHATNPVDWYPWCDEAFEKARKENKLIFLSVGYSTCHWCHVMERESFENGEIAKVMNEHFVNIKVDREERPDVDKMYMAFVQATTGGGGWPMSVWLTPELTPVYGGTYFPPDDRYFGRPGFKSVLQTLKIQWEGNRQKFSDSGRKVVEILKRASALDAASSAVPKPECIEKCFQQLAKSFDSKNGGFSESPKFPQPVNFNFLFHIHARNPSSEIGKNALDMCLFTLKKMAKGGIHDHVSQGFARYSTDERWHVPHFEKMLYDQAQLAVAYSAAYTASKEEFYADIVRDILTYVDRDLGDQSGGFYSAEDADSYPTHDSKKKKEGAFCVWTFDEIKRLLAKSLPEMSTSATLGDVFCYHYCVKTGGNVNPYQDPHDELKGQNVLIVEGSEEETAEHFKLTLEQTRVFLKEGCNILYEARQKRPRPHLDSKMLTAWNGLMISGYSKAYEALQDKSYAERAIKAANFIKEHLYNPQNQTLLRSCYRGEDGSVVQISSPISGFLDDYAFVVQGLLDLYEASLDDRWLEWAEKLQDQQDKLFWDSESAGYFTSPATDASAILRLKEDQDGAEPSGNSVSCLNLLRLSSLLERAELRERAGRLLATFSTRLARLPAAVPQLAVALSVYHDSPTQVFVAGPRESEETQSLVRAAQTTPVAGRVLALVQPGPDPEASPGAGLLASRSEAVRRMRPAGGRPAAYVCRHRACSLPVHSAADLRALLHQQ